MLIDLYDYKIVNMCIDKKNNFEKRKKLKYHFIIILVHLQQDIYQGQLLVLPIKMLYLTILSSETFF